MPAPTFTWADVVRTAGDAMLKVPEPSQTEILGFVANEVHYDVWGDDQYLAGSSYLAAHLAQLYLTSQGRGPVTSQSAGGLAISYAQMLQFFGQLGATSWGVEYSRRIRLLTETFGGIVT